MADTQQAENTVFTFAGVQFPALTPEMGEMAVKLYTMQALAGGVTGEKEVEQAVLKQFQAAFGTVAQAALAQLAEKLPQFNKDAHEHPDYANHMAALADAFRAINSRYETESKWEFAGILSDSIMLDLSQEDAVANAGDIMEDTEIIDASQYAEELEDGSIARGWILTARATTEQKNRRDIVIGWLKERAQSALKIRPEQFSVKECPEGYEIALAGTKSAAPKTGGKGTARVHHKFIVIGAGGAGNEASFQNSKDAAEWLTRAASSVPQEVKNRIKDSIAKGYGGEIYKTTYQKSGGYRVWNVAENGDKTPFQHPE